jgi:acetolactate synthase I/II/III large subunit
MSSNLDRALAQDVVGWGREAHWTSAGAWTASRYVGRELARLGVRHAFGVLGGGVAPFADGLCREIGFVHTRHEGGAVFAAIEAHFASGRPTAVVVTTGPGLFNALNGAMAARADGAKVVLISGASSRDRFGRGAVQETGSSTMPGVLTEDGKLFDIAARPETVGELTHVLQRLAIAWSQPGGCVAHLSVPASLQTMIVNPVLLPEVQAWERAELAPSPEVLDACLAKLSCGPAAIWIGHGARGASTELTRFAEAARLPVVGSPRAKGIFAEDHPLYVGASGAGGHSTVGDLFATRRPATVLVIGTRLGEVTSFLVDATTPARGWIHVDIDPRAFATAYPGVPGLAITCDARAFLAALYARADASGWFAARQPSAHVAIGRPAPIEPRADGDVRPDVLMQALQTRVVDATDAIVMSESGNAFTWCNYALRFATPDRYRTSAAWGSMGHFTSGPIGAAVATGRRVVTVVGDGAMLMQNEVSTAVSHRLPVIWVVLNDAQLGLNEHGMIALGMRRIETQLPRTDFVGYAHSLGATGVRVDTELDLAPALDQALAMTGPVIVDVRIDRTVPSPILAQRTQSLVSGS